MFTTLRIVRFFSIKPYNSNKNYYRILNISEKASPEEIKKSFRALAKKYHPDSNSGQ